MTPLLGLALRLGCWCVVLALVGVALWVAVVSG